MNPFYTPIDMTSRNGGNTAKVHAPPRPNADPPAGHPYPGVV